MSETIPQFDRIDLTLLALLQTEGRLTNAELAERVNLSASACLRRVQRLEREGVISGYGARLDPKRIGLGLEAFVRLQLEHRDRAQVERFAELVQSWDDVVSCYALTGDMDYLLHIAVADLDHFSRFLLDHLLREGIVANVNSSVVLRAVKAGRALPLTAARG
ncbi:Lrp/AsnC family transcriptional regulator [Xanthomonadaceae bacterium JHOS43]|nr:Lrp/AsnC family transcriptional regulator [Xanthomonadaceae bacterium JHOS43]MCX7562278.1 Lrp/AsnC family transcriptional regulator [Xanthomonadaceae bacterium XH05]